ncbi:MAG: HAMP domain-containing methyl-accepting chemotaxis protein [Acidimicrobiia bacterium]|nr:HAMP domain-containing methyl-accepting chemotaxis protein [Acidimicrobiia bacterium]
MSVIRSVVTRLTIGVKLALGFGAVVVLTVTIGWLAVSNLRSVDEGVAEVMDVAVAVEEASMEAAISLEEAQHAVNAFAAEIRALGLSSAEETYIPAANSAVANISAEIDVIGAVAPVAMVDLVAVARDATGQYGEVLAAFVTAHGSRATAQDDLILAAGEVEAWLATRNRPLVDAAFSNVRQAEKDYIISGDSARADALHESVGDVDDALWVSNLSARSEEDFHALADEYVAKFDAYVARDRGLTQARDLLDTEAEQLSTALDDIEVAGLELGDATAASLADTTASARGSTITFTTIAVLVGIVISLLSARSISRRVRAVRSIADRLAVGDTDVDLEVKRSGDEIGEMIDSMQATVHYLQDASAMADRIADGDLSGSFSPRSEADRLGTALNEMVANLREVVSRAKVVTVQMQDGSEVLATSSDESARAAGEVAHSIGGVADSAHAQVETTGDLSRAVLRITEDVEATAASVADVTDAAAWATSTAADGREKIDQANRAMQAIQTSFGEIEGSVSDLSADSVQVEEIVDLIRAIADQTNLLALNAAIEAARAGEFGRGFAVVAAEVKSLAEESAQSTEQIAGIVGKMRASVQETVGAVGSGREQVAAGGEVVDSAGVAFSEISSAVDQIDSKVQGVSQAAIRIQGAVGTIETSVWDLAAASDVNSTASEEVAAASEQSAATSEEIGATAQQLKASAADLANTMSRFTLDADAARGIVEVDSQRRTKSVVTDARKGWLTKLLRRG